MTTASYKWQEEAHENVTEPIVEREDHEIGVIPANVGSGKTYVGYDALATYIEKHIAEKTFQLFVCPRIRLVDQQLRDAKKYFANKNLSVAIEKYDCESDGSISKDWPKKDSEFITGAQHVIYFVCDKSLWGEPLIEEKWNAILDNNEQFGRLNGGIIYDEAHNYDNHQENIFGEVIAC